MKAARLNFYLSYWRAPWLGLRACASRGGGSDLDSRTGQVNQKSVSGFCMRLWMFYVIPGTGQILTGSSEGETFLLLSLLTSYRQVLFILNLHVSTELWVVQRPYEQVEYRAEHG